MTGTLVFGILSMVVFVGIGAYKTGRSVFS